MEKPNMWLPIGVSAMAFGYGITGAFYKDGDPWVHASALACLVVIAALTAWLAHSRAMLAYEQGLLIEAQNELIDLLNEEIDLIKSMPDELGPDEISGGEGIS